MSSLAIRIENLSKRFFIGAAQERATTFYDAVTSTISAPWRRFRMLSHKSAELEEFWALRDIEFDIQSGEVVGIIGHNGAGKSTLLKILSRIVEPTTGRIEIHGRVASLLEVGTGFHPELTGRENIYLNGSILGMTNKEIDTKFDAIVDFSGVEKFLDTPFKRYSSGMGVRLAFSVAAHLDPEILIIDEVLAVGDAQFQRKCLDKMREVAGGGRTVLFVSHNLGSVSTLCSRAILLQHGQVQQDDKASNVIESYLSSARDDEGEMIPLAKREDRSGNQAVRFIHASINSTELHHEGSLICGDDAIVTFQLEKNPNIARVEEIDVGFTFVDMRTQQVLCTLYSSYQNCVFTQTSDILQIQVRISPLPLAPGEYKMHIRAANDNRDIDNIFGHVAEFEVLPGNFYGTNWTGAHSHSRILIEGEWEYQSKN